MSIEKTLKQRGQRYGKFKDHAIIAQGLQDVLRADVTKWQKLPADMKQALTTICDKFARILNGDPFYHDNWHDIIGYAKLIQDTLTKQDLLTQDQINSVCIDKLQGNPVYMGSGSIGV